MESSYNLQPFMNSCSFAALPQLLSGEGLDPNDEMMLQAANASESRWALEWKTINSDNYITISYYIILSPVCLH